MEVRRWRPWRISSRHAVHAVCLASLCVMVSAQTATPPTSPCEPCLRGLATTVWGFIVTLVSLSVESWGFLKNRDDGTAVKVIIVVLYGATLNPILSIFDRFNNVMCYRTLAKNMKDTLSAKPYIKVLSGSFVYVNLSPASYERFQSSPSTLFEDDLDLKDFSDALRIGRQVEAENLLRLSPAGKEALIRANVLPSVEQLKILQAQSGFAVAATMVQAVGYMYGVLVRLAQHLHVSPVEAIAFVLNMLVLAKGIWHFSSKTCNRPLILLLEGEKEERFVAEVGKPSYADSYVESALMPSLQVLATFLAYQGMLVYFIIKSAKSVPFVSTVPLVLVAVYFPAMLLVFICAGENVGPFFMTLLPLVNIVSYIFALIVTIKYWSSEGFEIQSSNFLTDVLPYIG